MKLVSAGILYLKSVASCQGSLTPGFNISKDRITVTLWVRILVFNNGHQKKQTTSLLLACLSHTHFRKIPM